MFCIPGVEDQEFHEFGAIFTKYQGNPWRIVQKFAITPKKPINIFLHTPKEFQGPHYVE
jgi:hypothetical protein